jgi:hypothetical protein
MKIEAEARLMLTAESYEDYLHRLTNELKIKQIGEGAYSQVFQHPTLKNIVVKLSRRDTQYLKFARFAMDNPKNPWLPRIAAIEPIKVDGRDTSKAHAVFMEKLAPVSAGDKQKLIKTLTQTYDLRSSANPNFKWVAPFLWFEKSEWARLAKTNKDPGLAQFAVFTVKNFDHLDLHQQNIMKRGQQIVFVDPFR